MLIGVTGAKGSGKDTFALALIANGMVNLKMAGPLKEMLRTLYHCGGYGDNIITMKLEGDLKEVPCNLLLGQTPRWAMQSLGTEWRDLIHPHLWTQIWRSKAELLLAQGAHVICTDVRFHHEARVIRELGGRIYRIERPNHELNDNHPSEREMKELQVDETVYNAGSIRDLHKKARTIFEELAA